ncbi:hypothetical protein Bca52824_014946 [Brassica carinata]|uniref:Uncharacterized protein n=1 Tax=Brassica carinata TaxID=52824 RepID=A0A8X7W409_BRACI|nr:hypothetical protein Bca52824_014946 [Brassica carinata]
MLITADDELGNTAVRYSSGGWRSARLINGVEMAERCAYFGISSNLITYLTGPLTASAAANVNAWMGTVSFLPVLWAFVDDAFLGCFRTLAISSFLFIMDKPVSICALRYLERISPKETDQKEAKAKSSFFNWLMFGSCVSIWLTRLVSSYIQENLSWSLGFGIPSVFMLLALFLFLLGTTSYRFSAEEGGKKNPFA